MTFSNPIFTVARFEIKTLLRSWFFRIFAALVIVLLVFINLLSSTELGNTGWGGRMLNGGLPYLNLYILNIAQSIIAIFLSSDFLSRDKKLDTTEVVYVRSMSNFQYVFGKTLGILYVFGILNLVVLLFTFVINLVSPDAGFSLITYVIYPLIISVSTLVFVFGLSFFIMQLIRNQAVTFILLLGYIATVLFYLQNNLYGVWDYLGFFTPMAYSSYVGFANEQQLLIIRGGYFVLGLALILFTVLKLPRLTQSKKGNKFILFNALVLVILSIGGFSYYILNKWEVEKQVAQMHEIEKKLPINAGFEINHYQIDMDHHGNHLDGRIEVVLKSNIDDDLPKQLKFYFNNGLKVKKAFINGNQTEFNQHLNFLSVQNNRASKVKLKLRIEYEGMPNDKLVYFDLNTEKRSALNRFDPLIAGKKSSIVSSDYLLLTKEGLWYPIVAERNAFRLQYFFTCNIKLKTTNGLTVISQGENKVAEDGRISYTSKQPYSKISLVAAPFIKRTIQVDSIEYSLYVKEENYFLDKYFENITDTLPFLIRELKSDYERKLGLDYPYSKLSFVEVPIHFKSLFRSWSLTNENSQPEMIFIPESGVGIADLNLAQVFSREKKNAKRDNKELLPKELESKIFLRVVGNTFAQPVSGRGYFRRNDVGRTLDNWSTYSLFPLFYNYSYSVKEDGLPFYNMCLEAYMLSRIHATNPRSSQMSSNDKSILFLRNNSDNLEKLTDKDDLEISIADIIVTVGNNQFATAQARIGYEAFNGFVDSVLENNFYTLINGHIFDNLISSYDSATFSDDNFGKKQLKLPGFIFGENEAYEFKDGNRKRYFIGLDVANDGDVDGIVKVSVYGGGRGSGRSGGGSRSREGNRSSGGSGGGNRGRGQMTPTYEDIFLIEKDKNNRMGIILDSPPRMMLVHTYLSKNVPSDIRFPLADFTEAPKGLKTFAGIQQINKKIQLVKDGETIVDNESEGFSVVNTSGRKTLKEMILSNKDEENNGIDSEYKSLSFFRPAARWTPVLNSFSFGKHIKSIMYKKSGDGNAKAIFTAKLKVSGRYNVYAMIPSRRLGNFRNQDPDGAFYSFTVHHDDGDDVVEVPVDKDLSEWSLLGEFYFSDGEAVVELSDQTTKNVVIADAIKWVKL